MNSADCIFSQLKATVRTGWVQHGVPAPESVAEHSWGTAFLCLCYGHEAGIDTSRAVTMALVHDLAEARTGDLAWNPGIDEEKKHERERSAVTGICASLSEQGARAQIIAELTTEYMDAESPEALFVRDMNLIDMVLQATRYRTVRSGEALSMFHENSRMRLRTNFGTRLFDRLCG